MNPHDNNDRNENRDDYETVQDDGQVDRKIKDRILQARARIDEREDELFVRAQMDPNIRMSHADQLDAWGTTVRQYIRTIIPLLKSDEIDKARHYWEEVPIWQKTVAPPDGDKPWSKFAQDGIDETALAREMGLPPSVDPPEPKPVKYEGLREVLEREAVQLRWVVDTKPDVFGPEATSETLEVTFPTPKEALASATTAADEFLQQAGVGLEIGSGRPQANYSG